jgi:hypothetical protein
LGRADKSQVHQVSPRDGLNITVDQAGDEKHSFVGHNDELHEPGTDEQQKPQDQECQQKPGDESWRSASRYLGCCYGREQAARRRRQWRYEYSWMLFHGNDLPLVRQEISVDRSRHYVGSRR